MNVAFCLAAPDSIPSFLSKNVFTSLDFTSYRLQVSLNIAEIPDG
jgi:hypothetical protein